MRSFDLGRSAGSLFGSVRLKVISCFAVCRRHFVLCWRSMSSSRTMLDGLDRINHVVAYKATCDISMGEDSIEDRVFPNPIDSIRLNIRQGSN